MISEKIMIQNKLGLHARAAAKLVSTASGFSSSVLIEHENQEVNGKSIMGIMLLAAANGTEIVVKTDGNDESEALNAIRDLIHDRFGEDE